MTARPVLVARCEATSWDDTPDALVEVRCPGLLRFEWGMVQAACGACGAWSGVAVAEWSAVVLPGGDQLEDELAGVPGAEAPRLELANIRRLLGRHDVRPCDPHGEVRATIAMVEDALVRRAPVDTVREQVARGQWPMA